MKKTLLWKFVLVLLTIFVGLPLMWCIERSNNFIDWLDKALNEGFPYNN